jgi:hypothetical protein
MTECDYCGEEVPEDAYVAHLRDEHGDDLGPIDRRRVEAASGGDEGGSLPVGAGAIAGVVGVVALVGLVAFVTLGGGGGGDGTATALPDNGDPSLLSGVEQFPSEGANHVGAGTDIDYARMPPTSGPHYNGWTDAGFYDETPAMGRLVHSLEHGAVVVYYDPAAVTTDARESLRTFASAHTGQWRSVIVAPHPAADPDAAYVLTAWRHRLTMDEYDEETVRAFLAEYLGRGPENPVR